MGFLGCTDYLSGLEGESSGPYSSGTGPIQPFNRAQFAPLIDKMLGNAFMLVKVVADNIAVIKYIAFNMQALILLAEQAVTAQTAITNIAAATSALNTVDTLLTPTQAASILNLAIPSFPVYTGMGSAPVPTQGIYIDINGNLKVAG